MKFYSKANAFTGEFDVYAKFENSEGETIATKKERHFPTQENADQRAGELQREYADEQEAHRKRISEHKN